MNWANCALPIFQMPLPGTIPGIAEVKVISTKKRPPLSAEKIHDALCLVDFP